MTCSFVAISFCFLYDDSHDENKQKGLNHEKQR